MPDTKNRNITWIFLTFTIFLSLIIEIGCKKEEEKRIPELTTSEVQNITPTTATIGGNITSDGGSVVTVRGICWNISSNPTITDNKTVNNTSDNIFTSSVVGLSPNTTYYMRAYATNAVGTAYGNEVSFSTSPATLPILTTMAISSLTSTTVTSGGNITSDGGESVTVRGICWSTNATPNYSQQ